ncbi:MAG: DUF2274 domain-containing protein [Xanthomonadales bacterium PRO7]|nr:DUF2274 domain-containing protein [Xanthomonadales bacterium PRO7]
MSRSHTLPAIPVKHAIARKVLNLSAPLEARLRAYIAYYSEQQGLQPKQVPSESDTIIALIENFLARDVGFNRYLRNKTTATKSATKKEAGGVSA